MSMGSPRERRCRIAFALALGLLTSLSRAEDATQSPKDQRVKIAAVQFSGYDKGELPREGFAPVGKVVEYIQQCAKQSVDLIVFPEYVLGHIDVPGPETRKIAKAARQARAYVAIGCWHLHQGKLDGPISNTILLFDRNGEIAGTYQKTHAAIDHFEGTPAWLKPPQGKTREWFLKNDPEWTMVQGQRLPVFDTDFGKVGILTCYDGWFPEPARVLSLKGAELILWLNGRQGRVEDFIVKSIMFQSHVAMVTTNQAYGSGTMIAQWPAEVLATCPPKKEALIVASVDLARVRHARQNSRNFRRRRPDLYRTLVEPLEPVSPPVEFVDSAPSERVENSPKRPSNGSQ